MKKMLPYIIATLIGAAVFAQNVKPYVVDLNQMPATNNDKTATFDKTTKTITIKK